MSQHPNVTLARRLVAAFGQGDLATVGQSFAADAVWELPGSSPIAGTYKGPEEIVGFLAKAYELSGGTLRVDLIDILGSDWGAVQVQQVSAEHRGRSLRCVEVLAHQITDDKIVHTYHRPDQRAIDAFFS